MVTSTPAPTPPRSAVGRPQAPGCNEMLTLRAPPVIIRAAARPTSFATLHNIAPGRGQGTNQEPGPTLGVDPDADRARARVGQMDHQQVRSSIYAGAPSRSFLLEPGEFLLYGL